MRFLCGLQLVALLGALCRIGEALPHQETLLHTSSEPDFGVESGVGRRRLKGKFLHITADIHPDPFYKVYSSTDDVHACHRGTGPAGFYGAETSDCDTPLSLVNATFDWIKKNLKDEIDFVIWTGDSAKHDNDERIPRSEKQVTDQNSFIAEKFIEVFETYNGKSSIPIIPTLGNNDVLPHNIFKEGPNKWTKTYLNVWEKFIPDNQRKQFKKGGWFAIEVIPNQLAVISLNTLYFFNSNSAVNGCIEKSQPGFEHFEWLRKQLEHYRQRGMKAMLMGHVPPARVDSRADWVESCWQKYTLWQRQYRDVIVGSFYGHMNIDHFMLQDFKNIKKSVKKGYATLPKSAEPNDEQQEFDIMSAKDYLNDLREYFAKIPSFSINDERNEAEQVKEQSWLDDILDVVTGDKEDDPLRKIGGQFGERYSLAFVAPSLVPNYFPSLRIFEYNTSGLPEFLLKPGAVGTSSHDDEEHIDGNIESIEEKPRKHVDAIVVNKKKKKHHFKIPKKPSKTAVPGPAYSPQTFSLLGYTQYFANLTHINNDFANALEDDDLGADHWKPGKHHGKVKKGKPHPRKFNFHVEYDTMKDKRYGLKDLTVRSYIELARAIGKPTNGKERNKHWHAFVERAFVGSIDPEDLENQFGRFISEPQENGERGGAAFEL